MLPSFLTQLVFAAAVLARSTCHVKPGGSSKVDDAPAIIKAFDNCKHGGRGTFDNTTYHVNSVMDISGLNDVEVDLKGTLLVHATPIKTIPQIWKTLDLILAIAVVYRHFLLAQTLS